MEKQEAELLENNKQLMIYAFKDSLTGLSNMEVIKATILEYSLKGKEFFLAFMGLKNFSTINDSLGRATGDKLLREIGCNLNELIKEGEIIGRIYSDEFVIISCEQDKEIFRKRINEILHGIEKKYIINNYEIYIFIKCGIVHFPDDTDDPEQIISLAGHAMNLFKRNNIKINFYDKVLKHESEVMLRNENYLMRGLENGEFRLVYQPIIDAKTDKLVDFEALLRWECCDIDYYVGPDVFIPILERLGLIHEVGRFVIREAFKMLYKLNVVMNKNVSISINLSIVQFERFDFIDYIVNTALEEKINLEDVIFELTESLFINEDNKFLQNLYDIKSLKAKIALDDFGVGFSSFYRLSKLPIDILKIDKTFISNIEDNMVIVESIIKLAHDLGMKVISEGVEYKNELMYLKEKSCDLIQGYYYSKPLEKDVALMYEVSK